MTRDFLGKKLLVLTAHPDDESFLAAGTIYENHAQGGQTILLCASFGEKGDAFLDKPMSEERLKALRKSELERVVKFLRVRELVVLGVPDTNVRMHKRKIFTRGLALAKRYKPDVLISFSKYGFSGHRDHIAVGEVARRLQRVSGVALYTFTLSARAARLMTLRFKARAYDPIYTRKQPVFEKPTLKVAVDPKIKTKAILFHASQLGGKQPFSGLPPALRKERLTYEYFHTSDNS
jgi:LmbE family N-acetylglucosaminyl deacetylase